MLGASTARAEPKHLEQKLPDALAGGVKVDRRLLTGCTRGDMRLDPREVIDLLRPKIPNDSKCGSLGGEFADEYSHFRSALTR